MKNGFYTALGTPLDEHGNFMEASFRKQVKDQIAAGASGLLALGSMGCQPAVKTEECPKVAGACADAASGACPVFVGAMDNSIERVLARIESYRGLKIDGVVVTTPFYYVATQSELVNFYRSLASRSPFPIYIYDLPVATKTPLEVKTIETIMAEENIGGIKSGILPTVRMLLHSPAHKEGFTILFSGLDVCDTAYKWGLMKYLDGMFAMTPRSSGELGQLLGKGEWDSARDKLNTILEIRDRIKKIGIFRGFSEAMNLLGYEGWFAPDYCRPLSGEEKTFVRDNMDELGLL